MVVDSLVNNQWKLLNESKYIGKYQCFKAEMTIPLSENEKEEYKNKEKSSLVAQEEIKDKTITAWYAPEIPVSFGPKNYWGLPGLILELNDGEMMILCAKVTLSPKEKMIIKTPDSGRKVTREEFQIITNDKTRDRAGFSINVTNNK